MSATAIHQTPEAVRRLSLRSVREQIRKLDWMSPADRSCLERLMTEALPRWDALLHAERLRKWAKGEEAAGDVRAAGLIVLSNMLTQLVRNTTYFDGAPAKVAIAAIIEMGHPPPKGSKKADIAKTAIALATEKGWLPPELRTAHYDGAAVTKVATKNPQKANAKPAAKPKRKAAAQPRRRAA